MNFYSLTKKQFVAGNTLSVNITEAVDSDSDSEYEQVANYEFATELTPEELALGEELKKSQMRKNMIIDDSFNRNMHDDDKYAPDFFKEYEDKFVLRSGVDQHISKKSVS